MLRPTYGSLISHISNWLGFTDPPKHSRLRGLARSMLNPALAAAFRPWITAYVRGTIAEIRREEHVDLLDRLALRLPLALICAALGVPHAQAQQFHRWTCDVGPFAGRVDPSWSPGARRAVDRANESWLALEDMFRALIREKQRSPGDDLLTRLVSSTAEGTISDDELIGVSVFFLAAASRLALADLTLGGATIRAGDSVIVHLAGANRDPAAFDNPATFDVTRQNNRHLAFGRGPHFCLGAPLARAEAAVVFEEVGPLLPRLVLDKPNLRWRTGDMTDRCLTELKASWKS